MRCIGLFIVSRPFFFGKQLAYIDLRYAEIEDEENIRRHHTRDTVEKQFNETYCYLLKGVMCWGK